MSCSTVLDEIAGRGWTVVDLLEPPGIRDALAVVDDIGLDPDHPFHASPAMAWGPVARSIDLRLKAITSPSAQALLRGYRPFLAGVTSKGARSTRVIKFHQDWTYTDERRWRVVFLWCPLVDVDDHNAALSIVPGSHLWTDDLRPSRELEASEDLQEGLARRAVSVPLRAGQALAFDPAAFHGSGPNKTDSPRPAFTMGFAPVEAPLLHFHEDSRGNLSGFVVDEQFFTEHPYRTKPEGYPSVVPHAPAVTAATLARAIEAAHLP